MASSSDQINQTALQRLIKLVEKSRDIPNMEEALIPTASGNVIRPDVPHVESTQQAMTRIHMPAITEYPTTGREELNKLRVVDRKDVPNIGFVTLTGVNKEDWEDDMLKSYSGYKLTLMETKDLYPICQEVLSALCEGISERHCAQILLLAWNLRSGTYPGRCVYEAEDYYGVVGDSAINERPDTVMFTGVTPKLILTDISPENVVKATCYICASLLRLFTKRVDSYMLAYSRHVKKSYSKFYAEVYPLEKFTPDKKVLEGLVQVFSTMSKCKGSFGRFLYHYKGLQGDKGLCAMLFEQHVGLTGLHAFGLFMKAAVGLNVDGPTLISALWHMQTKVTLMAIGKIYKKYVDGAKTNPKLERQTWRYSRLFDHEYFTTLQTKNCTPLVCALASLCSLLGPSGNKNIMDIEALKSFPQLSKDRYMNWAMRVHAHYSPGIIARRSHMEGYTGCSPACLAREKK